MGLRQYFKDANQAQYFKKEANKAKIKVQHMIDILSATEEDDTGLYKGNEYRTYRKAVNAIDKKYNATAKWGVLQTGNIIDLRAAFIIARGIKVSARDKGVDADKEIEWANAFLEYNDLDKEMVQEFAKEAEIEGKILLKIDMENTLELLKYKEYAYKMVSTRYVSWLDKKYEVKVKEDDYKKYIKVEWTEGKKPGSLEADQFVYKKFGGRINDANSAQSKTMKCLTQIDSLDKALRDWREIDRIFGGPILYMECENQKEVDAFIEQIEGKNFKLKKILGGTGKLSFITLEISNVKSIENEILTLSKMISGTTGVSVQYLGLVELLKNRSTSDDLREMLSSSTVKERVTWEGAYEELLEKAMNLFNKTVYAQKEAKGKKLNPSLIKVTIPVITKQHWANIKDVWLPAVIAGKITEELFLEQLPGVDMTEEIERKKKRDASELQRIKDENKDLKIDQASQGIFKKEEEEE